MPIKTCMPIWKFLKSTALMHNKHSVFGYMNEFQVAMGESSIGNVRKMRNSTPTPKFDITMLTIIAMERCKTAREAIQLMGSMAEKHGYRKSGQRGNAGCPRS